MHRPQLLTLAFIAFAFPGLAQTQAQSEKATTKLEEFQSKDGSVIIRGFTEIGSIKGNGSLTVYAYESTNASNLNQKVSGIRIEIVEFGRILNESVAFIDTDEVDSLLRGIEYIAKTTKKITKQKNFEAEYRTRGGFRIVVFNDNKGEIAVSVSGGRIRTASLSLKIKDLSELTRLITAAKTN